MYAYVCICFPGGVHVCTVDKHCDAMGRAYVKESSKYEWVTYLHAYLTIAITIIIITPCMQVRTALERSAQDLGALGRDNSFGWGLVNAPAANTLLKSLTATNRQSQQSSLSNRRHRRGLRSDVS